MPPAQLLIQDWVWFQGWLARREAVIQLYCTGNAQHMRMLTSSRVCLEEWLISGGPEFGAPGSPVLRVQDQPHRLLSSTCTRTTGAKLCRGLGSNVSRTAARAQGLSRCSRSRQKPELGSVFASFTVPCRAHATSRDVRNMDTKHRTGENTFQTRTSGGRLGTWGSCCTTFCLCLPVED